jgi:anaerobic magnesium-protoporphyrin IX monomethyl ester cyclase
VDTKLGAAARVALVDVLEPGNRDDREHLGLASIAATLRRLSVPVDLLSFVVGDQGPAVSSDRYDLYGFSIYPQTAAEVSRYADALKTRQPAALVCAGGQLATAAAREILADCPSIDFCVLGDGETPISAVVRAMTDGRGIETIPSIVTRESDRSPIARSEIAELAWPERDLLPLSVASGNLTARLNASLGCAAACTFCSVNGFFDAEMAMTRRRRDATRLLQLLPGVDGGTAMAEAPTVRKRWRARPVESVFEEILHLRRRYGIRSFVFNDASFEDPGAIGKRRIADLCALIRSSGERLAFRCSVRAESFDIADRLLLDSMRSTGFTNIFVGAEAGNDHDLEVFNKSARVADNERTIALFSACDIDVTLGFIMMNPYSTPERLQQNYRFLARHRASVPSHYIGTVQVYFGTSLHQRLANDDLLSGFSYRNPYGYRYVHEEVVEIDRALQALRNLPELNELSGRMYSLGYTISTLRGLFGDDADTATAQFRAHQRSAADLLAWYFEPLFEQGSPGQVIELLPKFRDAIVQECRRLHSFRLRLLYLRAFRDYFLAPRVEAVAATP